MSYEPAATRREAMDRLMPVWLEARQVVQAAQVALEDAKTELKDAQKELGKRERSMEHVAECRQIACLKCEELAANG